MIERFIDRWYAIGVLLLCTATLHGCAAVKATEQPSKRNLSVLDAGVPRTHVIAELGAPTWSDERENQTMDVFTFKQGYAKETKAARALAHGAADVATLGLWEVVGIPFETIADGTDVQVEVRYGTDQKVASVIVIKGDQVVNPPPSLFARTFGGQHKRPKAASIAASRPSVHSRDRSPRRDSLPVRPRASDAFDDDPDDFSTASADVAIRQDSSVE